jgi:hypothetical protein
MTLGSSYFRESLRGLMGLRVSSCRSVITNERTEDTQTGQIINRHLQDFTEVDHNVTRHVPRELSERDWSAFIMHFLGLDHIGHKAGPKR